MHSRRWGVQQRVRQLAARALGAGMLALVAGFGAGGLRLEPALAASPAGSPVALSGYHVATFASSTAAYANPDAIMADGGFVYVAYQNKTKADGSDGGSSDIVQYSMEGTVVTTFRLKGHCDGLRADPASHLLWATVNEDTNALLYTIDPKNGTVTPYQFSAAAHGGGYDDLAFVDGKAFIAASNPTLNADGVNTGPAVVQVTLSAGTATVTPVLLGNAGAYDTTTNKTVTLNLVDSDSMTVDPQGDVVLVDQAGSDLIFLHHPGTPQQTVSHVPAGTQLEDTVWPNADQGRLFVVDAAANAVYTISGAVAAGSVYTEAPNDSGVAGWVGTIDLSSGISTPVAIGFGKATGLLFVPDPGATMVAPAPTASDSSQPPAGAATGTPFKASGSTALQATQTGTLAGNSGGSYATFELASPGAAPVTLTLSLGAFNGAQAHAIGINVYQHGALLGSATALNTGLNDPVTTSAPSLTVTPTSAGDPLTVQVYNYTASPVSYTLTRS